MSLITDKPENLSSGNDLDSIPDDLLETSPAYLSFGGSPAALDDPPCVGDVRTYIMKARCTAEHGPIERKDGEMRYTRTLSIIAAWESGKRPPPISVICWSSWFCCCHPSRVLSKGSRNGHPRGGCRPPLDRVGVKSSARECRRHHQKHWSAKTLGDGTQIQVCRLCGRVIG